jgi:dTMP kinase
MKIIAVEGSDAVGKRTQVRAIVDALRADNLQVWDGSFPRYDTFWGRLIKRYLHGQLGDMSPLGAGLLFANDRAEFGRCLPALAAACDAIVFDRYALSNLAHQAARIVVAQARNGGPEPALGPAALRDLLAQIEFDVNQLPRPDITVWLDADIDVTAAAMRDRGERDLHEIDLEYQREVRNQYSGMMRSGAYGRWAHVPVTEMSGTAGGHVWRNPQQITAECLHEIRRHLWGR